MIVLLAHSSEFEVSTKNSFPRPNQKQSFCALNTKITILKRTLCLICRIPFVNRMAFIHAIAKVSIELIALYFHSFEIFIFQIGEMAFCKPKFIIIKSNDDFEALVR
jgi:hypothetical protein